MNLSQQDQMQRIVRRWAQAHRKQDLLDWHSQTGMLMDMAGNATRIAVTAADREHASDLYTLAWLSYQRSVEFMPADLSRLPHLMCEAA